MQNIKQWLIEHDEKTLFTILYIGLSVLLSVFVSLFWLLAIVGVHAIIEYTALKHKREKRIFFELFWHIKLDLALVFFALFLSLYIEAMFGLLIAKYGTRFASFLAYQNALRGIFMTMDDMARGVKALFTIAKKKQSIPKKETEQERKASILDYLSIALLMVSIVGILLSPYILEIEIAQVVAKLSEELTPFP